MSERADVESGGPFHEPAGTQQVDSEGSGAEQRWRIYSRPDWDDAVFGPSTGPDGVAVVPESSLTAALARISDLEEGNWPYEWQVATKEREARKAAEQRVRELEGAIEAFVKWFEQTFPSDGKNLPGVTLFSIAERARTALSPNQGSQSK